MLRERKHARIACEELPVDEDAGCLGPRRAVAAETARSQSQPPDGEELTERERPHVGGLDVDDPGLVMGVERRDEALGFVDPDAGRNSDAPAVDVEVEVLMDVQGGPFLGERGKPERLQPTAQAGDVVRPGSPTGELPREVCGREGGEDEPPLAPAMTAPTTTVAPASVATVSRSRSRCAGITTASSATA